MIHLSDILPGVLECYPITMVHHEYLRTSENAVVKVRAADGTLYALRIRKLLGAYREQIQSELIVLRDLRHGTGMDIPVPVATRTGEWFCLFTVGGDPYVGVLFTWVAGVHVGGHEITLTQMSQMAQSVAQLHDFSRSYHPPAEFVRPVYDAAWFLGSASWCTGAEFVQRLNPGDAAFLRRLNDRMDAFLHSYPHNEATFGLIHYDLHAGNFLFGDGAANLIDFDECGWGYYLFDLAHILFEFVEHPDFALFKRTAVQQYAVQAGPVEDDDLTLFLALQGVAYANWLYRIFRRDGNEEAMVYWGPTIVRRVKAIMGS
jgi:Ser/Thr protein kinase RdoA (MazF antagonist)